MSVTTPRWETARILQRCTYPHRQVELLDGGTGECANAASPFEQPLPRFLAVFTKRASRRDRGNDDVN
jgi:hypothetical protein